jgi:hypothetical protein
MSAIGRTRPTTAGKLWRGGKDSTLDVAKAIADYAT